MWYKVDHDYLEISIRVKPNAKQTAFAAMTEDYLQLRLHAKPKEGEANEALISFFAKTFKIPATQVLLKRGEASRNKVLRMPMNEHLQQLLNDPRQFIKD